MAPSSLCMLTSVSAHRASLWKSSGIALMVSANACWVPAVFSMCCLQTVMFVA